MAITLNKRFTACKRCSFYSYFGEPFEWHQL